MRSSITAREKKKFYIAKLKDTKNILFANVMKCYWLLMKSKIVLNTFSLHNFVVAPSSIFYFIWFLLCFYFYLSEKNQSAVHKAHILYLFIWLLIRYLNSDDSCHFQSECCLRNVFFSLLCDSGVVAIKKLLRIWEKSQFNVWNDK